jgi:hypothetical protein
MMPTDAIAIVPDPETGALKLDGPDFVCPSCAHSAPCPGAMAGVVHCSECESRIAFGVPMPRVFVEPHNDRRFVVMRFETWDKVDQSWKPAYETVVDQQFGLMVWHNVQSICR